MPPPAPAPGRDVPPEAEAEGNAPLRLGVPAGSEAAAAAAAKAVARAPTVADSLSARAAKAELAPQPDSTSGPPDSPAVSKDNALSSSSCCCWYSSLSCCMEASTASAWEEKYDASGGRPDWRDTSPWAGLGWLDGEGSAEKLAVDRPAYSLSSSWRDTCSSSACREERAEAQCQKMVGVEDPFVNITFV